MRKMLLIIFAFTFSGILAAQAATGFTKLSNVSTTAYTDSTCPDLSACYYQVTAVDAQGFESIPAACSASQLCQAGNMAVALMPSSGTHTVALTWVASTSSGVTYNVYRHIGPFAPSALGATVN